ncbi:MAG: TIGR03000 domain-containing protein [Gemmataceae bacterium]|nr:TIGR03000 domain-containing protein [Gemmataceae bacterium]
MQASAVTAMLIGVPALLHAQRGGGGGGKGGGGGPPMGGGGGGMKGGGGGPPMGGGGGMKGGPPMGGGMPKGGPPPGGGGNNTIIVRPGGGYWGPGWGPGWGGGWGVGINASPWPYYGNSVYVRPYYDSPIIVESMASPTLAMPTRATPQSVTPLAADKVRLHIYLPSTDARLLINGEATTQQGSYRLFDSPAMDADKTWVYAFSATWMHNGREVTRKKEIDVKTGQEYTVEFTLDAEPAPKAMPK